MAAEVIASRLRTTTKTREYPKEVSPSISTDKAIKKEDSTRITISSKGGLGPLLSRVYELGSGLTGPERRRYLITPKNPNSVLAFPWEVSWNIGSPTVAPAGHTDSIAKQIVEDNPDSPYYGKAYLSSVMHPGVKPRPFINRSVESAETAFMEVIGDEVEKELKKILGSKREKW
jgi:hypothetical protein